MFNETSSSVNPNTFEDSVVAGHLDKLHNSVICQPKALNKLGSSQTPLNQNNKPAKFNQSLRSQVADQMRNSHLQVKADQDSNSVYFPGQKKLRKCGLGNPKKTRYAVPEKFIDPLGHIRSEPYVALIKDQV